MNKEEQLKQMTPYILSGKYINCSKCTNHDLEEAFPDDAPSIFYDKGWGYLDEMVLCPDCSVNRPIAPIPVVPKPDKCQSKEDGVCNLPIGTCTQCEQEITYTETEVYLLINKALNHYFALKKDEIEPLIDWFDKIKKK